MNNQINDLDWEDLLLEFMRVQENFDELYQKIKQTQNNILINFFEYTKDNIETPNIEKFKTIENLAENTSNLFIGTNELKKALIIKIFGYFPYYYHNDNQHLYSIIIIKLQEAIIILDKIDAKPLQGNFCNMLGAIFYDNKEYKEYKEAEEYYQKAILIREKLVNENFIKFANSLAGSLQNLAIILLETNKDYKRAETLYRQSIEIRKKLYQEDANFFGNSLAQSLQNLAIFLQKNKNDEEAEELYKEAINIRKVLVQKDINLRFNLAMSLQNFATFLNDKKRFKEAINYYVESINIFKESTKKNPKDFQIQHHLSICLHNLGITLYEKKEFIEAKKIYQESIKIKDMLIKNGFHGVEYSLAKSLQNLANVLYEQNIFIETEKYYKKAIDIYKKLIVKNPKVIESDLAMCLQNWANLLNKREKYSDAEKLYIEAISIYEKLVENNKFFRHDLSLALQNFGYMYFRIKNYHKAKIYFNKTLDIYEKYRENIIDFRDKINFSKESNKTYYGLIKTLIKLQEYKDAISIIESSKSRAIVDIIDNDFFTKIPKKLQKDFKRLQNENFYLIETLNKKEPIDKKSIEKEYDKKRIELNSLNKKILEIDPNFLLNTKPLNLKDMIAVVTKSNQCFIYFYITDDITLICIIYPYGEIEYLKIDFFTIDYLEDKIANIWINSYSNRKLDIFKTVSNKILNKLYEELLKEVTEKLKAKNIKDIVFIPNKALSLLPLHSCWYEENGKKRYLIDDFNISYAPSITIYKALQDREKKLTENFSSINIINPKKDLLFSGLEGLKIQNFTKNSNNLWHDEAKIKKFIDNSSTDIIHLSCHGSYNMNSPLDSAFAFSDENLTLKEIINSVNLEDNYLTILSACETGMVNFKEQSDEHLGLSIGFLMAKSPTVWGTLWSVNDFSTSLILIKAYEELIVNKRSKSEALNKAQIWVRDLRVEELVKVLKEYIREIEKNKEKYLQINNGLNSREFDDYLIYWDGALDEFKKLDSDKQIFEHPYYWAGFSCVGVS